MKTHKDLIVWNKSIDLVIETYKLSSNFPSDEKFGLTSQMRRAAVSVPSNIAEGAARNSTKEYIRFLYIALGSLSELETQFLIANRLGYLSELFEDNTTEIRKMLLSLIKTLKQKL
ncbi:four helix bundle protein [Lutibacter sp.]